MIRIIWFIHNMVQKNCSRVFKTVNGTEERTAFEGTRPCSNSFEAMNGSFSVFVLKVGVHEPRASHGALIKIGKAYVAHIRAPRTSQERDEQEVHLRKKKKLGIVHGQMNFSGSAFSKNHWMCCTSMWRTPFVTKLHIWTKCFRFLSQIEFEVVLIENLNSAI